MNSNQSPQGMRFPTHSIGVIAALVLIGIAFWFFDIEKIRELVLRSGIWGPLIFIIAKASTIVVAPISGSAIYPMAGAIFGFTHGFIYVFLGDALGSSIAFWLSRRFGRSMAVRMLGNIDNGYLGHVLDYLDSWKGLLQARIFFSALPEAVAYAAGLSRLSFIKFFIVQMGVAVPTIAILVTFGSLIHISTDPLILALLLGASAIVMFGGGALFAYQVAKRKQMVDKAREQRPTA
jgi:uncharacterized membrane protein YdjX (TVP38/TMEM64 family)